MTVAINADTWVYVVVQDPEKNEQILGQHDKEADITYIPTFLAKETAMMGIGRMAKPKGPRYEIQAVIFGDLMAHAAKGGFIIFVLDEDGAIMAKFSPTGEEI